jgi:hypothetical protein
MRCACGYEFALDPKRYGLADARFLAIVATASQQGTCYFTENGLYTAYCRRMARWHKLQAFVVAAIPPVVGLIVGQLTGAIVGILVAIPILRGMLRRKGPPRERFNTILGTYQNAKGPLENLLTEPGLNEPPPEWREPDLYSYGVERLLIVQRDLLVDLLVRNDFHTENRTLVLTGTGYPNYLVDVAADCLRSNPELPVFFLHDATPAGTGWMSQIIEENPLLPWSDHPCIDVGLSREDARRLGMLRSVDSGGERHAHPVDALPYAMLAAGLSGSLEKQIPFSQLLVQPGVGNDTTSFG